MQMNHVKTKDYARKMDPRRNVLVEMVDNSFTLLSVLIMSFLFVR